MTSPKTIFESYLGAFTANDTERAAALLTDDFEFDGPMMQTSGKSAFLEGAAQLGPIVRGYRMIRQFEDGDDVCSIYDFEVETPVGKGAIRMSEWSTVRDGKLASSRLIFDTPKFGALMPPS